MGEDKKACHPCKTNVCFTSEEIFTGLNVQIHYIQSCGQNNILKKVELCQTKLVEQPSSTKHKEQDDKGSKISPKLVTGDLQQKVAPWGSLSLHSNHLF